jgi:hypothetical protein
MRHRVGRQVVFFRYARFRIEPSDQIAELACIPDRAVGSPGSDRACAGRAAA